MGYETLTYDKDGHVAVITFDRPQKLNSLSRRMMDDLSAALDAVNADRDVRCLVITGAGDRAFSTGFDLDGFGLPTRTDEIREMLQFQYDVFLKIWNLRIPVIAAVNGYAVAAGSNIAMICDVTIASDRARFGEPELRHFALSPLLLLPWFNGNPKMVHYLYFTGDTITAEQALSLGMIAKVVPHDELMDEAMRMARRIALVPPYAVQMTKESIRRTYEIMGFLSALQLHKANDALVIGAAGIPEKDRFFELMAAGDMKAFLEHRDGPFKSQP
ncbi:MAG: enoyl-CoA hydratase/isomerase family protein [Chloroflexi bacterium]|nr:enoyl-CoA hydratase/isomerase family protein [Chloroflexota bacterium]